MRMFVAIIDSRQADDGFARMLLQQQLAMRRLRVDTNILQDRGVSSDGRSVVDSFPRVKDEGFYNRVVNTASRYSLSMD
jgi:hypothetical protein